MTYDLNYSPYDIPVEYINAVGLVALVSAQTENCVEHGIGGCLGVDFEYAAAVTTHMSAPLRDHVLRAAAEIRIDNLDDLDELDKLLDEVTAALATRNAYLHNRLGIDIKTGAVFSATAQARGRVEMGLTPISVDQIRNDALRIYNAGLALYGFFHRRGLIPSIPAGPRPRDHKSKAARKQRRKAALKGKTTP